VEIWITDPDMDPDPDRDTGKTCPSASTIVTSCYCEPILQVA